MLNVKLLAKIAAEIAVGEGKGLPKGVQPPTQYNTVWDWKYPRWPNRSLVEENLQPLALPRKALHEDILYAGDKEFANSKADSPSLTQFSTQKKMPTWNPPSWTGSEGKQNVGDVNSTAKGTGYSNKGPLSKMTIPVGKSSIGDPSPYSSDPYTKDYVGRYGIPHTWTNMGGVGGMGIGKGVPTTSPGIAK